MYYTLSWSLALSLLLLVGLTARVTRLAVEDLITAPIRNKIAAYANKGREWDFAKVKMSPGKPLQRVAEFFAAVLNCTWCASVWIGAAAVLSWDAWGDTKAWNLVALAATLSYVTGWLANREYSE
jgi:hypothetical protein